MNNKSIDTFVHILIENRERGKFYSSLKDESVNYLNEVINFLFPHFSYKVFNTKDDVIVKLQVLGKNLLSLLKVFNGETENVINNFILKIPEVYYKLWLDAEDIYKGDPASESIDEVILAYPGFMAIAIYRIAHELYKLQVPLIPRILTEHAHQITGIDIHPGAEIDSPFFIDHGTGIVIGQTTRIGKNVKIYQGVTLGALSVDKSLKNIKRHPTIEDDVIIYSQAVILGGETVIGKNSIIGGNVWITQSIPPSSIVSSKVEVKVRANQEYFDSMEFII